MTVSGILCNLVVGLTAAHVPVVYLAGTVPPESRLFVVLLLTSTLLLVNRIRNCSHGMRLAPLRAH